MWYLLIVSYQNGDVIYHGPFPTELRATQYACAIPNERGLRYHIKPLVKPYAVTIGVRVPNEDENWLPY